MDKINSIEWLPNIATLREVNLGQGNTPVIRSRNIGTSLGLDNLYFKLENLNPTGSYKDRFAWAAIGSMISEGKNHFVATSSGNSGAALAAFAAAYGMRCTVFLNELVPDGKLLQMAAYGAVLRRVRGFGIDQTVNDSVFRDLAKLSSSEGVPLFISAYKYSPNAMDGVKTISYELANQLSRIDDVFVPAGGGGLFVAIARGFRDLVLASRIAMPRMHVVQPLLNDTIVSSLNNGENFAKNTHTTTTISGLAVSKEIDGSAAIGHARSSGGSGVLIDDSDAFAAQELLLRKEGIFAEPAGAVALAGLIRHVSMRPINRKSSIVCVITGSGFKDTASLEHVSSDNKPSLIEPEGLNEEFRL